MDTELITAIASIFGSCTAIGLAIYGNKKTKKDVERIREKVEAFCRDFEQEKVRSQIYSATNQFHNKVIVKKGNINIDIKIQG